MELFRYRNLALGCFAFLVALFFSYYLNTIIRIATLVLAGVAILILSTIYVIKLGKKSLRLLTHVSPALLFVMLAMIISLIAFDSDELEAYCDGESHSVVATVTRVHYQTEYLGYYEIELSKIDGAPAEHKVKLTLFSAPLKRGDIVTMNGYFSKMESPNLGFDEASYNLSKGITTTFESDNFTLIGHESTPILDFFESANSFLDNRFKQIGDQDTYSMLSALFLGNRKNLSDSVSRDFARIGLSHVLALSGMHITIIVTMLGYALSTLHLPKIAKEAILILATFIFVGITGFSESALRAGVMVCIVYSLFFFGNRTSLISALFYSVTIICIFSPYSIFSVSLLLSFFAMLGCIVSSKLIHRVTFFRNIRNKIFRFIVYTFFASVFALLFTLPLTSLLFGSIAVLSPLTNVFISPLFSLLIYLSPVYLLVADIPYLSDALGWICIKTNQLSTFLGGRCASLDNIVIPISNNLQGIAILTVTLFIFGLLIIKRKYCLHMLLGTLGGIILFAVGCTVLFVQRASNVYVGGYSLDNDDVIFIEDKNELTLFDITKTAQSSYAVSYNISTYLGYYEIENYIITDYSSKTHLCFDNLSNVTIVRNVYLPKPENDQENETLSLVKDIAKDKDINVFITEKELYTESTKISLSQSSYLPRSERRAVAFSVEHKSLRFTYLGAGTFELCDYFVDESAYLSDIIIFGAYGPKYKTEYSYNAPYLDYCVFFGDSSDFAQKDFYESIKDKALSAADSPLRFKLNP